MSTVRYRANAPAVVAQVIDDEAVVMNLARGMYYSLRASAAAVWTLLDAGCDVHESAAILARAYGVEATRAMADLEPLLASLLEEELVVAAPDRAAPSASPGLDRFATIAYQAPSLDKYSDMQDLLALDPPMPEWKGVGR